MNIIAIAKYSAGAALVASLLAGCNATGGSSAIGSSTSATIPQPRPLTATTYYPPELWNGFVTPPTSGASPIDFDIVFTGNVTSDFPSPLQPGYGVYDPFCPPNQTCNNESISYNASTNTTTFSFNAIPPYYQLYHNMGTQTNEVHFGVLNGPGGTRVKCLKWYTEWTFASAPPQQTPVLNICNHKKVKTKKGAAEPTVFATVFVEESFSPITSSNPATAGTWIDVPYTQYSGSQEKQPKFTFTNETSKTIFTADSGIVLDQSYPTDPNCLTNLYCSENIANLELLNYAGMPPPGSSGSPFIKMQYPPASKIRGRR